MTRYVGLHVYACAECGEHYTDGALSSFIILDARRWSDGYTCKPSLAPDRSM